MCTAFAFYSDILYGKDYILQTQGYHGRRNCFPVQESAMHNITFPSSYKIIFRHLQWEILSSAFFSSQSGAVVHTDVLSPFCRSYGVIWTFLCSPMSVLELGQIQNFPGKLCRQKLFHFRLYFSIYSSTGYFGWNSCTRWIFISCEGTETRFLLSWQNISHGMRGAKIYMTIANGTRKNRINLAR